MRRLLSLFSAFIIGTLMSSPANSGQKDLGSGEFSTYVPIPTYTVVNGNWEKRSGKCYWEVDLKVKQLGGKEVNFGSFEVESPYLCEWDSLTDSGDIKPYLEKEAGYLNQVVEGVDEELKGKVGGSVLLYSFNFNDKGQNWYYTGGMFSGFLTSYGWQNAKSNKGEVFFYNSTGGQISLQAPKPTDRADALPVLDTSDSSYLGKKANELNHQVKGGYVLGDPTKKVVPLGGKYDTIAENYSDTDCGNSINIDAYKEGKGIRAFEEQEVMPYLRENNIDQAVVYFFYSPVVIDLDDDVDRREVWAECPGGYQYDCSIDKCFKVETHFLGCECHEVCSSCPEDSKDCTPECETVCTPQCSHEVLYAQPTYWFGVNHKITLHLSREARGEVVSADGKRTFLVDTELPLPDYTYNVYIKKKLPVSSMSGALSYVRNKSIAVDDCNYGQLETYNGGVPVNNVSSCSSPSFGCPYSCDSSNIISTSYQRPNSSSVSSGNSAGKTSLGRESLSQNSRNTATTNASGSNTSSSQPKRPKNDSRRCYATSTFSLALGKIGNNYWRGSCKKYTLTASFYVEDKDSLVSLKLKRAKFDDWIQVKVNGKVAYTGPYSGDYLTKTTIKKLYPSWLWEGDEPEYYIEPAICYLHSLTGECLKYKNCELSTSWDKYPDVELTPYIKSGLNNVEITVYVYDKGEGYIYLEGVGNGEVSCRSNYCKILSCR